MSEHDFMANKKAIEFQEMYYPDNYRMTCGEQKEAVRFAFAQGWEMASRYLYNIEHSRAKGVG